MEGTQIPGSSLKEETAVKATQSTRTFYEQEIKLHFVSTEKWVFVRVDSISIIIQ